MGGRGEGEMDEAASWKQPVAMWKVQTEVRVLSGLWKIHTQMAAGTLQLMGSRAALSALSRGHHQMQGSRGGGQVPPLGEKSGLVSRPEDLVAGEAGEAGGTRPGRKIMWGQRELGYWIRSLMALGN